MPAFQLGDKIFNLLLSQPNPLSPWFLNFLEETSFLGRSQDPQCSVVLAKLPTTLWKALISPNNTMGYPEMSILRICDMIWWRLGAVIFLGTDNVPLDREPYFQEVTKAEGKKSHVMCSQTCVRAQIEQEWAPTGQKELRHKARNLVLVKKVLDDPDH